MSPEEPLSLASLKQGEKAVVHALVGGFGFGKRLRSLGIREGKEICLDAKHHFCGPLVVDVDGRQVTIGRGMASKIIVRRAK
ncbi:MAG: FeoA family protein [Kiritimatiellia bacterium]